MLRRINEKRKMILSKLAFLMLIFISASLSANTELVNNEIASIKNYTLPKDEKEVSFQLRSQTGKSYLWIMAYPKHKKGYEHFVGQINIEVNGKIISSNHSILQSKAYNYPLDMRIRGIDYPKYDTKKNTWAFKYDNDFLMNNQSINRATVGLNHWYAFNLDGIVVNGTNVIKINIAETRGFYDGFVIGEIAFCSLDEINNKISIYNASQPYIPPQKLLWENFVKENFDLSIPNGRVQKIAVKDGYLEKDGKPFFMFYLNSFNPIAARKNIFNIYNYYALVNMTGIGNGFRTGREVMDLPIYLKPDWEAQSEMTKPWEIGFLLEEANGGYRSGILTMPYILYNKKSRLPYLEQNFPEIFCKAKNSDTFFVDAHGNPYPNYTNKMFQEYLRQMHTVLARTFKNHPGIGGYCTWEEMGWILSKPKDKLFPQMEEDIQLYRIFLEDKYKDIQMLNNAWHTDYKSFADICSPNWKETTGNFSAFQEWRTQGGQDCARIAYETLKHEDPNRIVLGMKTYGDIGASIGYWSIAVDNWGLTKYVDVSREYPSSSFQNLGRSCTQFYHKVMEADICMDERPDPDRPWYQLVDVEKRTNCYPDLMSKIFDGTKALHWEIYDVPTSPSKFYFIYFTDLYKSKTGKDNANIPQPQVYISEKAFKISRLHQWCIRNSSLILPAQVQKPQVALLMTTASRMTGHDPSHKFARTSRFYTKTWMDNIGLEFNLLGIMFDNLHLKFDCVEERNIDDIFKYKVLIAGYQSNVANKIIAEKVKDFVNRGGTVIFYPECFSFEATDFKSLKKSPGFGLDELCCASIDNSKIVQKKGIVDANNNKITDNEFPAVNLITGQNAVILAYADDKTPVLVSNPSGKCYYFAGFLGLAYGKSYPDNEKFVSLFDNILQKAGVIKPIIVESESKRFIIPGILEGKDYYLIGLNNFAEKTQNVHIKLNSIKPGKYEIIDLSGEVPIIEKDKDGNSRLLANFKTALPGYLSEPVTMEQLKNDGITVTIPADYSKIILLRPAGQKVIVNSTKDALVSYLKIGKPLKIVAGKSINVRCQELLRKLSEEFFNKGLNVEIVTDDKIKTKVVDDKLEANGYILGKYRHEIIDDDYNLILIGNSQNNEVIKHLQTQDNYTYCKVPEMVTTVYPGEGRGIIQIVECINKISYDATDKARDAIMISGSDDNGTIAAFERFIEIMK